MYISLDWINDFVKTPDLNIHDIANDFTMKTAEVEGVEVTNSHLTKIVVAQIKSLRKHPEADKLNLVVVDYNGKEDIEVVCGAPNVKEGLKIPYAPLGVTLPNGLTLEPKKIRGILSQGMLCSEVELGLGEDASGLMELSEDAPIGKALNEYLNISSDTIIEVDNKSLTHRPDLWGMYGIAREFAAIYETSLDNKFNEVWRENLEKNFTNEQSPIVPEIEKDTACTAFWGLSLKNIQVQDSPQWIKDRLLAVGLRPINNIVDISNYVMIELGMPLHIYDRDKIQDSKIIVKRLAEDSDFMTLDDISRDLKPEDTVICDSQKPLIIAGVMGGKTSGVSHETKNVFIEVANWNAQEIRKTSTRLGLRTDSSTRYEKSLDSHLTYRTLLRTLELILEQNPNAKVVGKAEYAGEDLKAEKLTLELSLDRINNHLGTQLEGSKVEAIFKSLDFQVTEKASESKTYLISVPTYRSTKDIEGSHDLIEEIGRIIGYDSIKNTSPQTCVKPVGLTPYKQIERKVQDFFSVQSQSLEVMSYPLVGLKSLEKASWPEMNEALKLVNPITIDADRMRPSLVSNFLEMAAINVKNHSSFSFFEWGRIYEACEKNFAKERNILGLCLFSKSENRFLENINQAEKFLDYIGVKSSLTKRSESRFSCDLISNEWGGIHPYECVDITIRGKSLGVVTSVHPLLLRSYKIKGQLSFLFLDLTSFTKSELKKVHKYSALPKFPVSQFDCSVVMKHEDEASKLIEAKKKVKIKDLVNMKIVDVFKLDENRKSVTVRFSFQDKNQTLSPETIKSYETKCVETLVGMGFPLKE